LWRKRCGASNEVRRPGQGVREAPGRVSFHVVNKDKVTQEHVFMISPGPAAASPLRHAADALAMVLGDDTGSRLYWALVDPGLAESADVAYHDYEGAGSFFTSFSSEPEQPQKNLAIIRGIFRQ